MEVSLRDHILIPECKGSFSFENLKTFSRLKLSGHEPCVPVWVNLPWRLVQRSRTSQTTIKCVPYGGCAHNPSWPGRRPAEPTRDDGHRQKTTRRTVACQTRPTDPAQSGALRRGRQTGAGGLRRPPGLWGRLACPPAMLCPTNLSPA